MAYYDDSENEELERQLSQRRRDVPPIIAPDAAPPLQPDAVDVVDKPAPIMKQQWTRQNVRDTLGGYAPTREGLDQAIKDNPWLGQQIGNQGGKIKDIHGSGEIWDVIGDLSSGNGKWQTLTGHTARDAAARGGGVVAGPNGPFQTGGLNTSDAVRSLTENSTYNTLQRRLQEILGPQSTDRNALMQQLLQRGF